MAELSSPISAWKMLDRIRANSPLSGHDFLQALTVLIFLRWADFQEAELEAVAVFDDISYEPVLPASLHWRTWHQMPPDELSHLLTERLPAALHRLNNSRHTPLATYLHRLAGQVEIFSKFPLHLLIDLIRILAAIPFETPTDRHQLLDAFDDFVETSQDKYTVEFKTPRHVARLMVELAAPAAGESVYDPCFGSASLLTTVFDYALRNAEQKNARYGGASLTISGSERNESAYILGLTRLALAGIHDPHLELGDSLERPPINNPQQDGFDVVVANPPWGWSAKIEPYRYQHFPVMTKDRIGLFIQHALTQLRPNGRAVIAVPQGMLFRGGDRRLREWLIKQHTVEAVISLPQTAFSPLTSIKSSILMLRRGGSTKQTRMLDAEPFFERGKGRHPVTISDSQTRELAEKIRDAKSSEYCWDVDAETLAETEFDLTPRRRDQSGLTVILEALRSSVPLVKLKDCCQIMIGRSIRSADLVDELPRIPMQSTSQQSLFEETSVKSKQQGLFSPVEPIPYIRIKDINKGQADKGTSWISAEAAVAVGGAWKLRAGDVLLSKSGTIGKVGIVRNSAVGAVAASGLYVLRTDGTRLDPHYLVAYLDSGDCRAWLQDRASGAVISHLTKGIIEEIPVPLPPLQIQQRVSAEWREHDVDVLAYLAQLLTDSERDPIAEWVEKELKTLPDDPKALFAPLDLSFLDHLVAEVRSLRNKTAHMVDIKSSLVAWLLAFNEALGPLHGVGKLPQGPGLLSLLIKSSGEFEHAKRIIKGNLPHEAKALKLTSFVIKLLDSSSAALISNVQLVFNAEVSTLRTGMMQEINLDVHNTSPLPLRNIEIFFEPDWGYSSIEYLKENDSETLGIFSSVLESAGPLMLFARWTALTIIGNRVEGEREIAFEVLADTAAKVDTKADLGPSPYVCGDPIRPERNDVFFGRDELLAQIRRQIVQSGNVVLLEGNRRAGKSSILRHLEGIVPVPGWLGVYCSLQGAEGSQEGVGVPTVAVFREIASSIAKGMVTLGVEVPLPDGSVLPAGKKIGIARACRKGISEESPFADFRDYAEVALDTVAEHKLGILLMLDEFDKLQEGIDNGVTSPQVPENIRYLVQTYPSFSAILTGSRRLKRLREEYWSALYGLGTRFDVTSLPHEAASKLVTEPVKGRLTYSRESMERVISLTNGQPYLLQCLCNRIFDMAAQLKIRSVTLDLVEQAGDLLAENNEHFASLWDYARSDRRRFILGLIHKEAEGPDPLRFGVLLELLSSHGIEVSDETLIADLEFLRELELVELVDETGSGHYALSIPLMGRWIGRQHDFEVLKKKARMETEDHDG